MPAFRSSAANHRRNPYKSRKWRETQTEPSAGACSPRHLPSQACSWFRLMTLCCSWLRREREKIEAKKVITSRCLLEADNWLWLLWIESYARVERGESFVRRRRVFGFNSSARALRLSEMSRDCCAMRTIEGWICGEGFSVNQANWKLHEGWEKLQDTSRGSKRRSLNRSLHPQTQQPPTPPPFRSKQIIKAIHRSLSKSKFLVKLRNLMCQSSQQINWLKWQFIYSEARN